MVKRNFLESCLWERMIWSAEPLLVSALERAPLVLLVRVRVWVAPFTSHTLLHTRTVHREDGSRLGCGLLEVVDDFLFADTTDLAGNTAAPAKSDVTVVPVVGTDQVCVAGKATGLEANIIASFRNANSDQCLATNGCGIHIHRYVTCWRCE